MSIDSGDSDLDRRVLPDRSTRGRKHAQDDEADEEFWQQEYWQDDETDGEFSVSSEEVDEVDSDFDLPEVVDDADEDEVEHEVRREERQQQKRSGRGGVAYVDPALKKPKRGKATTGDGEGAGGGGGDSSDGDGDGVGGGRRIARKGKTGIAPTRRSVRESTRSVTAAMSQLRERRKEEQEAKKLRRQSQPKKQPPRKLTQRELLEEAAITEQINLASVEAMSAVRDMERKKRHTQHAAPTGPRTVFHSFGGVQTITFIDTECPIPNVKKLEPVGVGVGVIVGGVVAPAQPRPQAKCAVTSQPAKYRDPLSGLPYADVEAFRELRRWYQSQKQGHNQSQTGQPDGIH